MHTHAPAGTPGEPTDRDICRTMARECLAYRVRRATRLLTRSYDLALAPAGLTSTQLTLLAAVSNRPDLRMAELADELGFEASSLSRAMALLAKRGWVKRTQTQDKRERLFEISERGREKIRGAWPLWQQAQADARRQLGGAAAVGGVMSALAGVAEPSLPR